MQRSLDPVTGQPTMKITNLTVIQVNNANEAMDYVHQALTQRKTGSTQQNSSSSRSHTLLQFTIEKWSTSSSSSTSPPTSSTTSHHALCTTSTLTMVDLAGSERISKSGSKGIRLKECQKINKSIAALGNCIAAIASNCKDHHRAIHNDQKKMNKNKNKNKKTRNKKQHHHVPFRDSPLTRLLETTLSGNTWVTLVANVGPSGEHYDETFSTLLLAKRALCVRNVVNASKKKKKEKSQAMVREEKKEMENVRKREIERETSRVMMRATRTPLVRRRDKVEENLSSRALRVHNGEGRTVTKTTTMKKQKKKNFLWSSPAPAPAPAPGSHLIPTLTKREKEEERENEKQHQLKENKSSEEETLVEIIRTLQNRLKDQQIKIEELEKRQDSLFVPPR